VISISIFFYILKYYFVAGIYVVLYFMCMLCDQYIKHCGHVVKNKIISKLSLFTDQSGDGKTHLNAKYGY